MPGAIANAAGLPMHGDDPTEDGFAGVDESPTWRITTSQPSREQPQRFGAFPFLLPIAVGITSVALKAHQRARARKAAQQQPSPQQPPLAAPAQAIQPPGPDLRRGLLGGTMPAHRVQPGRCRIMQTANGPVAVDSYGNQLPIEGGGGGGEQYMGADESLEEALYEDEGEDYGAMDELDEAAEEYMGAVLTEDDEEFGKSEKRLQKAIDKAERKIEHLETRRERIKQPFRRLKLKTNQKKLDKWRRKLSEAKKSMRTARRERKIAVSPGGALAAGAALAAGGAAAGALASRGGATAVAGRRAGAPLASATRQHALRRAQANAGQRFVAEAPPGSGRLSPLPMFTAAAVGVNPRNALSVPAALITAGTDLQTEDIPYALVEIVGFTSSQRGTATDNNAIGLVEDFKIRGGTNLFLHEGPAPADSYDTGLDRLTGLRAYPYVRSPNQGFVTVKASGDIDDVVVIVASTIVDVIQDDTYGAGFPGPYA